MIKKEYKAYKSPKKYLEYDEQEGQEDLEDLNDKAEDLELDDEDEIVYIEEDESFDDSYVEEVDEDYDVKHNEDYDGESDGDSGVIEDSDVVVSDESAESSDEFDIELDIDEVDLPKEAESNIVDMSEIYEEIKRSEKTGRLYRGSFSFVRFLIGNLLSIGFLAVAALTILIAAQFSFNAGNEIAVGLIETRDSEEFRFVLDEDASLLSVAAQLEKLGVVPNRWMFMAEMIMRKSSGEIEAGTYVLDASWSVSQINSILRGTVPVQREEIRVVIPEGFGIREIAARLEKQGFFTAEEFIREADNFSGGPLFLINVPDRPNRLEGYLFPDTYLFDSESTPKQIINRMLNRFDEVFTAEFHMHAEALGMTMDEIVILASMVEREVKIADERPVVAGVMYNRLKHNMLMQIDATVLYPMEERVDRLLLGHLEVDTPYNTYIHPGLPVGPIGNPGLACIQAAIFPDDHAYFYYVVSNRDTGEHHFSKTLEEHQEWAAKYQEGF